MAASKLRLFPFIAVPLMILMLPLSIYFVDSAQASEKVSRNVTIAGVDVARQTQLEATASVGEYTDEVSAQVTRVDVNGTIYELVPEDVGLSFDSTSAVDEALIVHKGGIGDWFSAFSTEVDVPLAASMDPEKIESVLAMWEQDAIGNPAFEGAVSVSNGTITHEYPRQGEVIDRSRSEALLLQALETKTTSLVVLPIVESTPSLANSDIDDAVEEVQRIIDRGVVLTNTEYGFEFRVSPDELGRALQTAVVTEGG
ncbi:MAG: hypothetical protein M3112_04030, partial [Actinomycetia bacterium]|nr:hypothetical protein [Actinomycetes bacterium]